MNLTSNKNQQTITISAKNLDIALVKAAGELATSPKNVHHKVIKEKSGFLGLGREITIEAWTISASSPSRSKSVSKSAARGASKKAVHKGKKHSKKKPSRSSPQPHSSAKSRPPGSSSNTRPELSPEQLTALTSELSTYLGEILAAGFGVEEAVKTRTVPQPRGSTRLILDVPSQVIADLITEDGGFAEALEHLLRKKPHHLKRELPFKIFIDGLSVRQKREEELAALAKEMSLKAISTQESVVIDCPSSHERKTIHLALSDDHRVRTKSVGRGHQRKLMIIPRPAR